MQLMQMNICYVINYSNTVEPNTYYSEYLAIRLSISKYECMYVCMYLHVHM